MWFINTICRDSRVTVAIEADDINEANEIFNKKVMSQNDSSDIKKRVENAAIENSHSAQMWERWRHHEKRTNPYEDEFDIMIYKHDPDEQDENFPCLYNLTIEFEEDTNNPLAMNGEKRYSSKTKKQISDILLRWMKDFRLEIVDYTHVKKMPACYDVCEYKFKATKRDKPRITIDRDFVTI